MKKILSLIITAIMCFTMIGTVMAAEMNFTDVTSSDWFYNDVKTAVEMGLVNGKNETTYAPNDNLTYAEAIKLAACMNMLYLEGSVSLESGTPWYKPYVDYCIENAIIDKEYNYDDNATRAGYMGIFANALPEEGLVEINNVPDNSIPDVPSSRAYAPAVYKLYRAGILTGVDEAHNCNPLANITRAEVAAILTRMMNETKRVSITDMGNAEEQKPEATEPEETEPEETKPEATEPEATKPEETKPEATEPEDKEPETTEPSTGGAKDKFQQVDAEELKNEDFSMTIDKVVVVTGKGIVLTGYISAGKVNVGDTVYINDADNVRIAQTTVTGIEMFKKSLEEAKKGDNAGILVDLDVDTYRSKIVAGNILSAKGGSLGTRPSTVSRPSTVTRPTTPTTEPLAIEQQTQSFTAKANNIATLEISVSGGTAPYSYAWKVYKRMGAKYSTNATELVDVEGTVKGSKTSMLQIVHTATGTYKYVCEITDANGNTVTSESIVVTCNEIATEGRSTIPTSGKSDYLE